MPKKVNKVTQAKNELLDKLKIAVEQNNLLDIAAITTELNTLANTELFDVPKKRGRPKKQKDTPQPVIVKARRPSARTDVPEGVTNHTREAKSEDDKRIARTEQVSRGKQPTFINK